MLTTQEVDSLTRLIEGKRTPKDGMETHFLRVIQGQAMPCSPLERAWYQYWKDGLHRVEKTDSHQPRGEETAAALCEQEERIKYLEQCIEKLKLEQVRRIQIDHLIIEKLKLEQARLIEIHRVTISEKYATIESLKKEVALLDKFLKNAHKTLQKYEPLPPLIMTDIQAANERAATRMAHNSMVIYSSTDGQD